MIRTLVVDDDYRVAAIHAACVEQAAGFTTVGTVHTAGQTRAAVETLHPDLLLLDLYLPDEHGLSLMRSLGEAGKRRPDFLAITAARDVGSIRTAMQLGTIHYVVKPFSLARLRDQLSAYRQARDHLATLQEADQQAVDAAYQMLRGPGPTKPALSGLSPTMIRIWETVRAAPDDLSAVDVAEIIGTSRPTAQRYLAQLVRRGLLELQLRYGNTGRPEHRYRRAH